MYSRRSGHSNSRVNPLPLFVLMMFAALALWFLVTDVHAQSLVPARLASPIEFGAGYAVGKSDYTNEELSGPGVYVDVNVLTHFAFVATFHRLSTSDASVTESTFTAGIRAHKHFRLATPYIQAVAGEGYLQRETGGSSRVDSSVVTGGGGGVEFPLPKRFELRADYEYQRWLPVVGFYGLNAHLETFGLTYRIAPGYNRDR